MQRNRDPLNLHLPSCLTLAKESRYRKNRLIPDGAGSTMSLNRTLKLLTPVS
jgi:hypothetical protein